MTDEPSVDPGEDDVRRILGSADRPRALRDDELTRLRSKVEGLAAPMSPATMRGISFRSLPWSP